MRNTCLNMVHDLAKADPRPVFIGSDLSPGLLSGMQKEMPERYYMEGITEANVIGMAAGFAMEGFIPYVNTIATSSPGAVTSRWPSICACTICRSA